MFTYMNQHISDRLGDVLVWNVKFALRWNGSIKVFPDTL